MAEKKTKKKKPKKRKSTGVPGRKKGESLVAYHDRLSSMAAEALEEGKTRLSTRLQKRAGELAAKQPEVARRSRTAKTPRRGPGTYPWYQCMRDQTERGYPRDRASAICGSIRAKSKAKYPEYWEARERPAPNPGKGGEPYVALALDAGPHFGRQNPTRDLIAVFDCECRVLDVWPILGEHSLREFDERYPNIPVIGGMSTPSIPVLASYPRDVIRAHELGPARVQTRNRK